MSPLFVKGAWAARFFSSLTIFMTSISCGFAVPLYEYKGERSKLIDHANEKGPKGMEAYKARKSTASIDGIVGLRLPAPGGRQM